jgi:hypothetical protein
MARMYPDQIRENTQSHAEREYFDIIRAELSDDWLVCHSLGLISHARKPWAEIDFVLIGPLGLFCIEVKGGTVARREGVWYFGGDTKKEGPFDQVGGARAALFNNLAARFPWLYDVVSGYGVVMPDVVFGQTGPDLETGVLYDARDRAATFSTYVRRLNAFWAERMEKAYRRPMRSITPAECRDLLTAIRGDFELVPSLYAQVHHALGELLRLTEEQYRRLEELSDNDQVIIRGGAGTGKTLLAVTEARRLARRAGRTDPAGRILFCCFNRNLAKYVRGALQDCSNVDVRTFHALTKELVDAAGLQSRLPAAEVSDLFEIFYPEVAVEALFELGRVQNYAALIIDEAQDLLRNTYLDVFDALLSGGLAGGNWRVFWDPYQNLFAGLEPEGLKRLRSFHPVQQRLSINCRNTQPIAVSYSLLSGLDLDETHRVDGPQVAHYWYLNEAEARRHVADCVKMLLRDGTPAKGIVILSSKRRESTCLRTGFPPGVPAVLADYDDPTSEPPRNTIRFATVGSFKGLEADAVLLLDLLDLANSETRRIIYVGASRARAFLALFLPEAERPAYEQAALAYGRRQREQFRLGAD